MKRLALALVFFVLACNNAKLDLQNTPRAHLARVETLEFEAKGARLLSGSPIDYKVWDVKTGKLVERYGKPSPNTLSTCAVTLSRDRRHDACAADASVEMDGWSIPNTKKTRVLSAAKDEVVTFDGTLLTIHRREGQPTTRTVHEVFTSRPAVSRDGLRVAVPATRTSVALIDVLTGNEHVITVPAVNGLRFSDDGSRLAIAQGKAVAIHEAATGAPVTTCRQDSGRGGLEILGFPGDLLTTDAGWTFHRWDAATCTQRFGLVLKDRKGTVRKSYAHAFSADGSRLAVYPEGDYDVRVYDTSSGRLVKTVGGKTYHPSPKIDRIGVGDSHVAVASATSLVLWSVDGGKPTVLADPDLQVREK